MDTSALSYSTDSESSLAPSYNTHSEDVSGVLPSYSSAPSSIDSTFGKSEAPMLTYSSSPTSAAAGDGQGTVNRAEEPLFYASSAPSSTDYTPENVSEAPMLIYSSSPASGDFQDGQSSTVSTSPFYSMAGSMTPADQEAMLLAAVPSFNATESKEVLSYSLVPDPAGTEKWVAPFYSSGPAFYTGGSSSKGPSGVAVAQGDSKNTEALFYSSFPSNDIEADNADVKVPFYTATPSDIGTDNQEAQFYTLATFASSIVPSYNLTSSLANTEGSGTSSPQYMLQAQYDGSFEPVERDAIEMSAWPIETADNVTTDLESDPSLYRFDNPLKDIVKGSDAWYDFTMYDYTTQTYHFPNGETQFIGIPPRDLTDSSNSENYADSSAPSYSATLPYDSAILNPNCSSSAESTSAGLLDLPSPKLTSTIDEWSRLSGFLEQQVLSLCAILDLWRFRAVCKRWYSLICAPECGKFLCSRNANEDARYIIGRCFYRHFEACHTIESGRILKYIKVVGWKLSDLKERRWYTSTGQLLNTYCNDRSLVSDKGSIVSSTTMAATYDHPLASDGGFVLCCSMLPGTEIISEMIIINPIVMTKMVLPMPVAWNILYLSSFLVTLAVDSISQAYKIFLVNRYEDPFLSIFYSTTNQWRISSNPPVRQLHDKGAGAQAHSVIFQGQFYVLFKTYRVPGSTEGRPSKFWLHRYFLPEDSWADCKVDFPEWPYNHGGERKQLVVSGNRLFVVSGYTLQLETRNGKIRMLDPLSVFEILLADSTLITESHWAEPVFDAEGLEVDRPTYTIFHPKFGEVVAVSSFEFNQAFGFGNSIMLTYRWLGFSIVYDVERRLWELLPADPTVVLYGNVMPLRPPTTSDKPISHYKRIGPIVASIVEC